MVNPKVKIKIEEQINLEFYSSYLYVSLSNDFQYKNLQGFADYFSKAAQEESKHAFKFINYLDDNLEKINLYQIQTPPNSWDTIDAMLDAAVQHELLVTERILAIKAASEDLRDYNTSQFINWFVNEQIEEVNKVTVLRDRVRL